MILLSAIMKQCIEWGWLRDNPVKTIPWPATSKPRRRGISDAEITEITVKLATAKIIAAAP
jgi:hypothetical protein